MIESEIKEGTFFMIRDFTKSVISFSWAMSLFGFKQLLNSAQPGKAAQSFESVTSATERELGEALKSTFRVGDNMQRGLVDLMFNILTLQIFTPGGMQQAAQIFQRPGSGQSSGDSSGSKQTGTGWGPMP
jgi:uncharacterized membrane protein